MMSMLKSGLRKDQKGQAAVEALLVLMIMALVIFGGLELSRGVAIRQALDSSTGAAVRALSLDPTQWSYSRDLVRDGTNQNVMGESVTTPSRSLMQPGLYVVQPGFQEVLLGRLSFLKHPLRSRQIFHFYLNRS